MRATKQSIQPFHRKCGRERERVDAPPSLRGQAGTPGVPCDDKANWDTTRRFIGSAQPQPRRQLDSPPAARAPVAFLNSTVACGVKTTYTNCSMLKPVSFAVTLALIGGWNSGLAEESGTPADTAYLFAYFTGNGEDGLHLAGSSDGYRWEALNRDRSYLAPTVGKKEKLMRAPSVTLGADGVYHLVWSTGLNEVGIGHATTRDFVHWSSEQEIPVMASEPQARNAWAPQMIYQPKWRQYLIIWASAVQGKFTETDRAAGKDYNCRIYCTTTKDFVYFSPARLFYDPGYTVIDATVLQANGRFFVIAKNETPKKKNLIIASSDTIDGMYSEPSEPFTPKGMLVEGPSAIKIGNEYVVYFEAYFEKHYRAMSSRDWETSQDVTARMKFPGEGTPERMRHGAVIAVPAKLLADLSRLPSPRAGRPPRRRRILGLRGSRRPP